MIIKFDSAIFGTDVIWVSVHSIMIKLIYSIYSIMPSTLYLKLSTLQPSNLRSQLLVMIKCPEDRTLVHDDRTIVQAQHVALSAYDTAALQAINTIGDQVSNVFVPDICLYCIRGGSAKCASPGPRDLGLRYWSGVLDDRVACLCVDVGGQHLAVRDGCVG